jgi:hypothetical protein
VHPHMLRHATGYRLTNDGRDTRASQLYMGHQNITYRALYRARRWPLHPPGSPVNGNGIRTCKRSICPGTRSRTQALRSPVRTNWVAHWLTGRTQRSVLRLPRATIAKVA